MTGRRKHVTKLVLDVKHLSDSIENLYDSNYRFKY